MMADQENFTHNVRGVATTADKIDWILVADSLRCSNLFEHFQWHDITACTSVDFQLCALTINLDFDKHLFRCCPFMAVNWFDDIRLVVIMTMDVLPLDDLHTF